MSAGLAAPLIGAGAVAVLGSGSAAIFTGASGIAVITSIFGAAGAGLTGKGGGFDNVTVGFCFIMNWKVVYKTQRKRVMD